MIEDSKLLTNLNIHTDNINYQPNLKNDYINKLVGPPLEKFRVPLQIENWFLLLDKENKEKTVKNFEIILKKKLPFK
jgi:hypothetical protein